VFLEIQASTFLNFPKCSSKFNTPKIEDHLGVFYMLFTRAGLESKGI
jgi:hypothetical protein